MKIIINSSGGFIFLPYKETNPIVGGISTNSIYYKSTKRQVGFLGDVDVDLYLDVYEPEGDTIEDRPLIIMLFGETFFNSDVKPFIPIDIIFLLIFIVGRFFPIDLSPKVFFAVNSESLAAFAPCNMVVASLASKIFSLFIS